MSAIVKNMIVRVGADFSQLFGEIKTANKKVRSEVDAIAKSASGTNIGKQMSGAAGSAAKELEAVRKQIQQKDDYATRLDLATRKYRKDPQFGATSLQHDALQQERDKVVKEIDRLMGKEVILKVRAETEGASSELAQVAESTRQVRQETGRADKPIRSIGQRMKSAFSSVWSIMKQAAKYSREAASGVDEVADSTRRVQKEANKADKPVKKIGQNLRSTVSGGRHASKSLDDVWRSIKRVGIVAAGLRIVSAVTGELRSVVSGYISENKALNAQVEALRTSLGNALAPVINIVVQAFSAAMPYILGVSNAIGGLLEKVAGSGWAAITGNANAYADATRAAASEQAKFNGQLAGFDEVTKLGTDDSTSAANIAAKPSWLSDTINKIKDAIGSKNGWNDVGTAISAGINAALQKINEFIRNFDWKAVGTVLSAGINTALQMINECIHIFDWNAVGVGIASAFNGIDWKTILPNAATTLESVLNGLSASISGFARTFDFVQFADDLYDGLCGAIASVNWSDLASNMFEALGNVVGGAAAFMVEFGKQLWESTKTYFNEYISDAGGNVVEGLWNGICDAFASVGEWIQNNILDPFLRGFKAVFGIHSPAKNPDLLDAAGNVARGILNGIAAPFKAVANWVKSNILDPIKSALTADPVEIVAKMKNAASEWWADTKKWWAEKAIEGAKFSAKLINDSSEWWANTKKWWNAKVDEGCKFAAKLKNDSSEWWSNTKKWWAEKAKQSALSVSAKVQLIKDGWKSLSEFIGSITKSINITVDWKTSGLNFLEQAISDYLFQGQGFPRGLKFAAKGGIVNAATLFGDTVVGEAGQEALVPLERNTQWADIVSAQIAANLQRLLPQRQGSAQPININLILDGRVVGQAAVQYINGQAVATGINPLSAYI